MAITIPGYENPSSDGKKSFFDYHENTYHIISRFAYLIGVPKSIFESRSEPPEIDIYNKLNSNKNARIVRNLCMLRTDLERNYREIYENMRYQLKNLGSLPEYITQEALMELEQDGISIVRANYQPIDYIRDINRQLVNRVNNVKNVFPGWLNWDYVKELFIMPNGLNDQGLKAAASEYYANRGGYPYGVYLNWPYSNSGNILYTDQKFVRLLYEAHEDQFEDMSKVTDAGIRTKNEIYGFLEAAERITIVADCENSDPYKIYAMLNNLSQERLLDRINKIMLYDDVHASSAWNLLDEFTQIPIEYILIQRLKEHKSLADIKVSVGVCREYYENRTDAFILASSDSDFWGLISAMPELKFYVLVESNKVSPDIKNALENGGYSYCYIDDFCTGNSEQLKQHALLEFIRKRLAEECSFNINGILQEAYQDTRATLTDAEKKQFYERFIKPMKIKTDKDGQVTVELGK